MNSFILAHKRKKSESSTPSVGGSDLVKLGILPKQISEFTDDDIRNKTTIFIPYNDESGKILLNDGRIEFEVVGVNHHTSDEHPQTISLMTKNIIRHLITFDAKEPNNPNSDRRNFGNNRWSVSNIRQWLNSSGAANSWFKPQHDYDEAPTTDKVERADGAYVADPGFLAGFSDDVLQHFTDITNITALHSVDGGGTETTVDKVFLPSLTEMGYGNNGSVAEGSHLYIRYPDNVSRIKQINEGNFQYWMRSPNVDESYEPCYVKFVSPYGDAPNRYVYESTYGLAPIIVLH